MNFEFSPEQIQIKEEARKVLGNDGALLSLRKVVDSGTSFDRKLWDQLGSLGFLSAAIPEAYGGTGVGYAELCVIAEEIGRANAALPFSSSICLGAEIILAVGSEEQKQRYLPRLASGESIACLAITEGVGAIAPEAIRAKEVNQRLHGSKWPVLDGDVADIAIVVARSGDGISLYVVELGGAGVHRTVLPTIDPSRSQARLDLEDVHAELLTADGWPTLVRALDKAAVLGAFEQVGGAERALEMGRDYALERYAFGRPIGSFQAIKHKLVDMYVAVTLARSNCYFGAWALANGSDELPEAAAAARVSATQAQQLCTKENIQVHGGMGFAWELDCHFYYRRAHLLAVSLGGLTQWQDRLIDSLRARRAHA